MSIYDLYLVPLVLLLSYYSKLLVKLLAIKLLAVKLLVIKLLFTRLEPRKHMCFFKLKTLTFPETLVS